MSTATHTPIRIEASVGTRSLAHVHTAVVVAAIAAWSGWLFAIVREHHLEFRTQKFDLGNMVQAVWSTAQGRPLEVTDASGEQVSRLAWHIDPILALLTPAWLVAPSPLTLAAVQVVACALGALPVLWLGRRHLENATAALVLALGYLAYPWLAWIALDAMHPVTFAVPLLLYAIWALDSERFVLFTVFAVLALLTGELVGVTVAALGLWFGLARRRPRAGLLIVAGALAWSLLAVYVVVPAFSGGASPYYSAYEEVGGSPGGVVRTAVTDPAAIASALLAEDDLSYLVRLGLPLAGLFVLSPLLAAAALPQILANTLSSITTTSDPHWHYSSVAIPILVAATVLGIGRLGARSRPAAAVTVLAVSVGISVLVGPWSQLWGAGRLAPHQAWVGATPSAGHIAALRDAVALVPADAPVSSTGKAGAHLSARRYVYSVPRLGRAEWVVVDERDPVIHGGVEATERRHEAGRVDPARIARLLAELDASPLWNRVFYRSGVSVYRRADAS